MFIYIYIYIYKKIYVKYYYVTSQHLNQQQSFIINIIKKIIKI